MLATCITLVPLLLTQSTDGAPIVGSYTDWNSVGCYEDIVTARALPHVEQISGEMAVEKCLDACHASGYAYAGLEWGQGPFCGPSLPPTQVTDGRCNMPCQGDTTEICGGSLGLSVYRYTSSNLTNYKTWSYDNCYVDSIWNRVLPNSKFVSGPMTIEKCLDACDAAGYTYAGLKYGGDEFCGGSNGLSVYHSTGAPQPIDEYNGSTFSGCYKDSTRNRVPQHRAAPEHDYDQTIEICTDACNALGYAFAGVEYASECWCGDARPAELATDGRCNMRCVGNHQERCGGPDGIGVYESHPQTTTSTSTSTSTSSTSTDTNTSTSTSSTTTETTGTSIPPSIGHAGGVVLESK
ncbi:SubName: Full=Related to glyoxal oxidase {ECO:0000313/EMBL:CCA74839.1} [Serendipita indica DSM 11827]|nr:SubName: Full=Related to glyoxal oxidase {ECO:0000313/EMBL:CCA74839.1} [Serendipita indica DSM 11827]